MCSFYAYPMRACDAQPNSITHIGLKLFRYAFNSTPKLESYDLRYYRPDVFFSCTGGRVGTLPPPSLNARNSLFFFLYYLLCGVIANNIIDIIISSNFTNNNISQSHTSLTQRMGLYTFFPAKLRFAAVSRSGFDCSFLSAS